MKKAAILLSIALFALATALLASPARSTSNSEQVTIRSLARQVNALKSQVKTLRSRVSATRKAASAAQTTAAAALARADTANATAGTANATANKLDNCLGRSLALTRYGDFLGTAAPEIFTVFDPDVQGQVPVVRSTDAFGSTVGIDVTATGDSVGYYVAVVEPSCAGGFRIAERQGAVAR
jgi:outer membrane murein-binding lipoprotein Lpp